jgi:hypothetical protein
MLRSSIHTAGVVALSAAAFAQQELRNFERVTGPVKNAGVYHLATGTWTRGAAAQQLTAGAGGDVIYSNTTDSGYFAALDPGHVWTASGRLPSLNSPQSVWNASALPVGSQQGSAIGCANSYTIDGFGVAYCTDSAGPGSTLMTVAFYQSWNPTCTTPVTAPPQGGPFALALPGRGTAVQLCWAVTIDLAATTSSFSMLADGDGAYLGNTDDAFAWTFTFPSITSAAALTGPLIAGCPADGTGPNHTGLGWMQFPNTINTEAGGYDGTRFDTFDSQTPTWPANGAVGLPTPGVHPGFGGTAEAGTDPVGDDAFRIEGGAAPAPGCYFFGGPIGSGGAFDGPYANYYLDLYAKVTCAPPPPGTEYCAGDGLDPLVTFACPCANFGGVGRGCASSFNSNGAHITATGSVANNDVVLQGDGMNATGFCIFISGNVEDTGGVQFGDGVACFNGPGSTLIRLRSVALTAGSSAFPVPPETITLSQRSGTFPGSGDLRSYGVYYRNAAATFCPPNTFNVSNGYRIIW